MTREEAKRQLEYLSVCVENHVKMAINSRDRQAIDIAIEALEQPEIIRCNDCMHNGSFDTDCPIDWAGKDYCNFAERRTDEWMGNS